MSTVLGEELARIRSAPSSDPSKTGTAATGKPAKDDPPLRFDDEDVLKEASAANLCGLALSGGGIRSATFNLGVLQALAELKLLSRIDYLSTVSGGGYIGAWLTALVYHSRRIDTVESRGIEAVEERLARSVREPYGAVRFLREYSNYLTPRTGFFGADTWSAISIYARNMTLNLAILVGVLVVVLLLPLLLLPGFERVASLKAPGWIVGAASVFVEPSRVEQSGLADWLAFACFVPAVILAGFNLRYLHDCGDKDSWTRTFSGQGAVLFGIVLPALVGGFFIAASTWDPRGTEADLPLKVFLSSVSLWWIFLWFVLVASWHVGRQIPAAGTAGRRPSLWMLLFAAVLSAIASGVLAAALVGVIDHADLSVTDSATWLTFGPPLAIAIVSLSAVLNLGLMGRNVSEEVREWWARVGGWLLIVSLAWVGLCLVSLFGPFLLDFAGRKLKVSAAIAWLTTTGVGLLLGSSAATRVGQPHSNPIREWFAGIAPYVFLVGLLLVLAWLNAWALRTAFGTAAGADADTTLISFPCGFTTFCTIPWSPVFWTCIVALSISLALSWRVDINAFSLQPLYRNRLVRCYLGASNPLRTPQPFTGFDDGDDIGLAKLGDPPGALRPYPLINVALNLVKGEDLAWQERKATAFTLAPLHCGFGDAYRRTSKYAGGELTLGEAFATSGAAASPNMGYHSNPALAFLMTIFNVRLGRWLGNPQHPAHWDKPSPRLGLGALLSELFGNTNDKAPFVYLSDGGHFDNLGLYELVRRRCRFIIVCDATADAQVRFGDLGSAIRKCRTDFGLDVRLDTTSLRIDPQGGRSRAHCAVAHLEYGDKSTGTILYLKASLTGREAVDVLNYASDDATFPHQNTADQWFSESQFESYRRLGYHCGMTVFEAAAARLKKETQKPTADGTGLEGVFTHLRERWYPPTGLADGTFARHAARLDALTERLRVDPNLSFLDAQILPTWKDLMTGTEKPVAGNGKQPQGTVQAGDDGSWLPHDAEARRAGFYFCSSLLQLMESVYVDQALETHYEHPDNRGWMNLFNHWAWCNMLRVTWALTAATYGARFQTFCRDRLNLPAVGEIEAVPVTLDKLNFVERELASHQTLKGGKLYALKLRVSNPDSASTNGARASIDFSVGFAVVKDTELHYLRIQDQLRSMGLGRRALRALVAEGVKSIADPKPKEEVPDSDYETSAGRATLKRLFDSVSVESLQGVADRNTSSARRSAVS